MRTRNPSIAAPITIRASHRRRIPLPNRRKPVSSDEPAARVRRRRQPPHPLPAPDRASGHGMRLQRPGPSSHRTVHRSAPVMFRSSVDNRLENPLARTAFPAVPLVLHIAADPQPPVRRRPRPRTAAAEQAAPGITDSAAGISLRTIARDQIARAVHRREFRSEIPSVRPITRAVAFRHRLRLLHNLRAVPDPVTGSGNRRATSGSEFRAIAVAAVPLAVPALHRIILGSTVTRVAALDARFRLAVRPPLMIPANHRHRQRRAIPTTAKASVAGSGTEPHGSSSLQRARSSVRAIRHRHSLERRTVRSSRCAVRLPSAAVKSLAMSGTCP